MKIVIIGAVALGASCAARLKRLNPSYEVILLEKGNYASFANCGLPYFLSDTIKNKGDLLVTSKEIFTNRFQIDLRIRNEALKIDPHNKKVEVLDHNTNETYMLDYDKLVLAMGTEAIKPRIEGIDDKAVHYLKTIDDAVSLKSSLKDAKKVAVIGGGFIGLEAMENLVEMGKKVTLIEAKPSVSTLDFDMAQIIHKIIRGYGVDLQLETMVQGIKRLEDGTVDVLTNKGKVNVDQVLMSVGVKPLTQIAVDAGIEIDENRTIKVNDFLQTNFPDIYAGGDLVSNQEAISNHSVYVPLANYANKHGRIIANNIHFGNKQTRQHITMASVFKLFNYTIAAVGLGEFMANKFGIQSKALIQVANSHAAYYPGATPIFGKIRFNNEGTILGGQFIGTDLVEKRVDSLSAYLLRGCTYLDLMENESSYAPPFNAAKDILNMFGFMIDNVVNMNLKTITPIELKKIENDVFILDVRNKEAYRHGHIANAINIPLDELREHLDELPKDQTIYVNCVVGHTSYNAICILRDLGYDLVNITGGYTAYQTMLK